MVVRLPAGTPVSITVDKGLSQVTYGQTTLQEGKTQMAGFSQAEDRYEISVNVGLGAVRFEEY